MQGGVLLLIRRMSATFGRLQGQTLELREGLNILQAPNEAGKSTWCAFLISMLFGVNSRERDRAGFIADKNRYAPWTGNSMSGRLECRSGQDELTLIRTTRRPTAPLGAFQAVYTGTGEPVPGLTGQTCGEALLGVSREVFSRSAFIRQGGLPIDQDVGLERRISALISSGEEGTSYSEAADLLKRQLNRRRHNRTGQLPVLETELLETERQITEVEALEEKFLQARSQVERLTAGRAALEAELESCGRWETLRRRRELTAADDAVVRAERKAGGLRRLIDEEHIPENDAIGRLRGAIVNLETVRRSLKKLRTEEEGAQAILGQAREALSGSAFAGMTPEQAERQPLNLKPRPRFPLWAAAVLALLGLAAGAAVYVAWRDPAAAAAAGGVLTGALCLAAGLLTGRRQRRWEAEAAALRLRRQEALEEFGERYRAVQSAQEAVNAKSAAADGLQATLSANEEGILLEVRRFAPAVSDIASADQALRGCAVRRRELAEAEAAAREARLRRELLGRQMDSAVGEEGDMLPPARDKEAVSAELEQVRGELASARSEADRLTGRLHASGDPVVLRSAAAHLRERTAALETEYGALQLAISTLEHANAALQTRFSPALGRRAAEIFRELTDGRYDGVVLDRSFRASAGRAGDTVSRDAALLSAGAADQLYLAVRLAICELVLPEENAVPIVLDDALANFDDDRCAAALRWLRARAGERQILLFTCHSREAAFFAGDPGVSVQRLTDAAPQV